MNRDGGAGQPVISMAKIIVFKENDLMKKRFLCLMLVLVCALSLSACGSPKEFKPNYEKAIGMILVNSSQALPEDEKVYAAFSDHQYLFHLDAAAVYYFNASAEIAYAGDENFAKLSFVAQIDEDTVGAQGTVNYWLNDGSDNTLDAYYVYHDETGVYFESGKAVAHVDMGGGAAQTVTLSEFPCAIEVKAAEPIRRFVVTCFDETGAVVMVQSYDAERVEDGEQIEVENGIVKITVEKYADSDELIETEQMTAENSTTNIGCESGGQVLGSKLIRLIWDME